MKCTILQVVTPCNMAKVDRCSSEMSADQLWASTVFWGVTPCSPLKVSRCFGGTYHLHHQGRRISRARYQRESRWQAGSKCTSETSVQLHGTTRRYISEDITLHIHRCDNLKSCERVNSCSGQRSSCVPNATSMMCPTEGSYHFNVQP
jgi:hypothetical protein